MRAVLASSALAAFLPLADSPAADSHIHRRTEHSTRAVNYTKGVHPNQILAEDSGLRT